MRIKLIPFVTCTILSVVSKITFAQGLTISSGTTFSLGSATLTVSGNWANSGTFNAGSGTVIFADASGDQSITNASGETFNNVTVNKAAGDVRLANNITVSGTLTCTNGDLDLNGHVVTLTGTLSESSGNTVKGTSGYITCTSNLNAPSASNPHGIGIAITSASNLGNTTINRGHAAQTGEGNAGILRYFTVAPTNNASLNATLGLKYDESELNSIPESELTAFRSDDGGSSWSRISGSTLNSGANTVSFSGQSTLSRFTLASGSNPLSDDPMPEMIVIGNGNEIVDGDAVPGASKHTAFGTININSTVVRTFTIENTGDAPLTLSGSPRVVVGGTHTSDFIVTTQPPASVAASSSTTFQVTFDPTAAGRRTATISIDNNDSDENPYNFAIHGTCTLGPEMVVTGNGNEITDGDASPSLSDHTDFGLVDVSSGTVVRTFTIENAGDEALTLETSETARVVVSGTHASDFSVTTQPPVSSIDASGNTTFQVTFDPSAAGTRSATLTISNNDSDENPYNFVIQGTGTTIPVPEIAVTGNGQLIPDGDIFADVADGTNFGSADVSSATVVRTFTIENSGNAVLTLETNATDRVVVSGTHASDFTVTAQPSVSSIGAGSSTTFQVTFNPSATGTRSATLSISNNDSDENPYNFAIQGTGMITPVPEIAVTGNGYEIANGDLYPSTTDHTDFGSVNVTSGTLVRTFTIENSGTGDIHLQPTESLRIIVNGTHASDFIVSTQPAELISAGNSTTFQVTFDPSATGLRTVTLSISNNDGDENPYIFNIQGTGTTTSIPEIIVKGNGNEIADGDASPALSDYTDFGSADVSSGTVVRTFTIENAGDASLTLSGSPRVAVGGTHANNFTVTTQPLVSSIGAGSSTTFQVTFDPSATGTRSATLSISNNDSDENPYNFAIQGAGTTPVPEIAVIGNGHEIACGDLYPSTTDHTDFGSVNVTSGSVVRTFTIENSGTGDIHLMPNESSRVVVNGTHASEFTVITQPDELVSEGGGTTVFEVTFNPSGTGLRTVTLSISNNDGDENPYIFNIQGTGQHPQPQRFLSKGTD